MENGGSVPKSISNEELGGEDVWYRGKFFKHLKIEKKLSEPEEKLLHLAEISARRHGFDNLLAYLTGRS